MHKSLIAQSLLIALSLSCQATDIVFHQTPEDHTLHGVNPRSKDTLWDLPLSGDVRIVEKSNSEAHNKVILADKRWNSYRLLDLNKSTGVVSFDHEIVLDQAPRKVVKFGNGYFVTCYGEREEPAFDRAKIEEQENQRLKGGNLVYVNQAGEAQVLATNIVPDCLKVSGDKVYALSYFTLGFEVHTFTFKSTLQHRSLAIPNNDAGNLRHPNHGKIKRIPGSDRVAVYIKGGARFYFTEDSFGSIRDYCLPYDEIANIAFLNDGTIYLHSYTSTNRSQPTAPKVGVLQKANLNASGDSVKWETMPAETVGSVHSLKKTADGNDVVFTGRHNSTDYMGNAKFAHVHSLLFNNIPLETYRGDLSHIQSVADSWTSDSLRDPTNFELTTKGGVMVMHKADHSSFNPHAYGISAGMVGKSLNSSGFIVTDLAGNKLQRFSSNSANGGVEVHTQRGGASLLLDLTGDPFTNAGRETLLARTVLWYETPQSKPVTLFSGGKRKREKFFI